MSGTTNGPIRSTPSPSSLQCQIICLSMWGPCNGWCLAGFAESPPRLYLEVCELRRARPAGIAPRGGCRCCRTRLDGLTESFPQRVRRCWKGGRQLCPRVSRGSVIDCTAVAFNYDSTRSMQKAAGAKVTFLHSDYSRLLCGATVLCLHPSADQVWFVGLLPRVVCRQETNTCKYSYNCQVWHLENLVQRHRPSL